MACAPRPEPMTADLSGAVLTTVGSTSESQKAWSSCPSSCSVHGSVLPLLRRSHVESREVLRTGSSRDIVICTGRVVDAISTLLHARLQRRSALAVVGVRALHHCTAHGIGAELRGGDIPDASTT